MLAKNVTDKLEKLEVEEKKEDPKEKFIGALNRQLRKGTQLALLCS